VTGTVSKELLAITDDHANLGIDELRFSILRPVRGESNQMYDWRNHVPNYLRAIWIVLSIEAKLAAYLVAKQESDSEDWDSDLE
jgi:hypothetical protein